MNIRQVEVFLCRVRPALLGAVLLAVLGSATAAPGDARRGAKVFRACALCHALEPGLHLAGPSLAGVIGRKAGRAEGFGRYSQALANADLVWDDRTLDAWLRDPQQLLPGNAMAFAGMGEERARADLLAYLHAVQEGRMTPEATPGPTDLKRLTAAQRVRAVRYCGDAYHVATEDGRSHALWEFNLRLKTDGSARGPAPGVPVLIPAGMSGDRASLIFARPEEIGTLVRRQCP